MKKITALLILLILWYFSGMFRQPAVMSLILCAVFVVVILLGLAIYQLFHINISLPKAKIITYKNVENRIEFNVENKSIIPVNRFKIIFVTGYTGVKKRIRKKFSGAALGKNENKDNISEFFMIPPYCGLVDIELKKIKVYDNMTLFSLSKKLDDHVQIFVMPVPKLMNISMPVFGGYDNMPMTEMLSHKSGDDNSEIRQVREYRTGDLYRHIHHNYSARTDSLWTKEYRKENDFVFDILVDTSHEGALPIEYSDAFYEILYSLVYTLIQNEMILKVHWFERSLKGLRSFDVNNEKDALEMMAALYSADSSCTKQEFYGAASVLKNEFMKINTSLEWYFGEKAVYRFSVQDIEKQLAGLIFDLNVN